MTSAAEKLDAMSDGDAVAALMRCCGSTRWARAMAARRPFDSDAALYTAADELWADATRDDVLEAFTHHPRIGASLDALREKFAATATWSAGEQASVTAAPDWDRPPALVRVQPALAGSIEALFHELDVPDFVLSLRGSPAADALRGVRLERAIGVVYRPQTERVSHYFDARVADQFDAVIHFDGTRAVEPLDSVREWSEVAAEPETYPTGF